MRPPLSARALSAVTPLKFLLRSLRALLVIDMRTYRPEKFYMRGPGPKWREKHGAALPKPMGR
jgi:hypothetical protein